VHRNSLAGRHRTAPDAGVTPVRRSLRASVPRDGCFKVGGGAIRRLLSFLVWRQGSVPEQSRDFRMCVKLGYIRLPASMLSHERQRIKATVYVVARRASGGRRGRERQLGLGACRSRPPVCGGSGEPLLPRRGRGAAPRLLCRRNLRLSLTQMRDFRERCPRPPPGPLASSMPATPVAMEHAESLSSSLCCCPNALSDYLIVPHSTYLHRRVF